MKTHFQYAGQCFAVKAGMTERQQSDPNVVQSRRVKEVINHPKYIPIDLLRIPIPLYDFCGIKVYEEFQITPFVKPISMATSLTPIGTTCIVSGFGKVSQEELYSYRALLG